MVSGIMVGVPHKLRPGSQQTVWKLGEVGRSLVLPCHIIFSEETYRFGEVPGSASVRRDNLRGNDATGWIIDTFGIDFDGK